MKDRKKPTTSSFYNLKPPKSALRQNVYSDKYPNDNLFKLDKRYKMNKYLDFEANDEQSFQLFHKALFSLKIENLSILCFFRVLSNCTYTSPIDIYKRTYYLFSFSLIYYLIKVADISNGYLRMFLKLLFQLNTVLIILASDTPQVLTLQYVGSELFFTYIHCMFLNLSVMYLLPLFTAVTLILVFKATVANTATHSLSGYVRLVLYSHGFPSLAALVMFFMMLYCYLKAKRELWALFDSFKKSYLIFNDLIFRESKAPSIVLSKSFAILFANAPALAFLETLKDNKLKAKRGFNGLNENVFLNANMLDFIGPQETEEFVLQFNRCLAEKRHKFFYPFRAIRQPAESGCTLSGESSPEKSCKEEHLCMVIPSRCLWKNQECNFVRICPESDGTAGYNYLHVYSKSLIDELISLAQDAEKVCKKLVDSEVKYEQYALLLDKLNNRNIAGNEQETLNKIIQQKSSLESSVLLINDEHQDDLQARNAPSGNHFFNKSRKQSINQMFPTVDHSILFYFKNQFEVFYDFQLTKEIFTSILLQTPHIITTQLNLRALANYFEDYFFMILRTKHFKLRFVIKCDSSIAVEYSFLRTILFNTLMFIYSNTDDDLSEKSIIYSISLEKEPKVSSEMLELGIKRAKMLLGAMADETSQDYSFDLFNSTNTYILRFSIAIWDDKQKANYNEVLKELQHRSLQRFYFKEEMEKVMKYDIGLMTVFYLITAVYSKELEMYSKEGDHTFAFEIGCGIAKDDDDLMQFDEIESNIANGYYKDLLKRVYHITIPEAELIEKSNSLRYMNSPASKTLFHKKRKSKTSTSQNHRSAKAKKNSSSKENNVAYSDTEQKKEAPAQEDKRKSSGCLRETYNFKYKKTKFLSSTKSLHFYKPNKLSIDPSFFNPPKFLIVEDNPFGRNQLINLITELNIEYQIVIAENGTIAMNKLKRVYGKNKLYDLVFMSLNLADNTTMEIPKMIRNTERRYPPDLQTKIIGISINPSDKSAESNHFDHYMEKPIQKQLLFKVIRAAVGKNRMKIGK